MSRKNGVNLRESAQVYLNHGGTKIRVFQVCVRAPFPPPFFPHSSPRSYPFSPPHLPLYPPSLTPEKLWFRYPMTYPAPRLDYICTSKRLKSVSVIFGHQFQNIVEKCKCNCQESHYSRKIAPEMIAPEKLIQKLENLSASVIFQRLLPKN